jgi:hypothetical protein
MSFGPRPRAQRAAPAAPPQSAEAPTGTQQNCANAAADIVALLTAAYTVHGRLQCGPAIVAAAALTGEFALHAVRGRLPENGAMSVSETDDVLFAGAPHGRPTAWMFVMHAAREAGVPAYELPRIEALAAAFDPSSVAEVPLLSAPEDYLPRELPQDVGPRFRHKIIGIADTHDLTLREVAITLGAATGQLILRTQQDFPPRTAVTLAAEVMLLTARTAPRAEAVPA